MKPRIVMGGTGAVAGMFATGLIAFACIPIATLNLSATSVSPGSTVTASIHQVSGSSVPPVVFHWGSVDGQVLASVAPTDAGTTATLTIPAVSKSGDYLIVATEAAQTGNTTWGMPARAVIHVDVPGAAAAQPGPAAGTVGQTGGAGLSSQSGVGTGALVLIALATAAFGLLVVGGATALAGRGAGAEAVRKG